MASEKFPPSNQRPAGTKAQSSLRNADPYTAAAAYAAAAQGPQVDDEDDSLPPGFGLGSAGPRPGTASPRPTPKQPVRKKRKSIGIPNIRLLPVTIVVAGLMLSVRVNDIWLGLGHTPLSGVSLNSSEAQQPPPPGGRKKGAKLPTDAPAASTAGAEPTPLAQTAAGAAKPQANDAPDLPPAVPAQSGSGGEPPTFTQNELDVLQKLSERREALDARERDMELRENLVKAAEARIDKKIAEMKGMQTSVEGMLKQVDEQDDAKMKSLAKMYESMKPKDAGKIFDQLDLRTLTGVIPHMKEQKAGLIIANMSPDKAKDLTDAIAQRRAAKAEGLQPLN